MNLKEFLLTADPDHNIALQQAKDFTTTAGSLIPATTVNQLFAQLDLTGVIKDASENLSHAARHKLLSVLLSVQGNHEFNFIEGTAAGNGNLAMLDWLIGVAMTEHAVALTQFKAIVHAMSNKATKPFANTTLHDVLIARGVCPTKPLIYDGSGYAYITTTEVCDTHNPRILGVNPITGQTQRVNSFIGVSEVRTYEAIIPRQFTGWDFVVDDVYEVI